jgi:hypothetical protein
MISTPLLIFLVCTIATLAIIVGGVIYRIVRSKRPPE